VLRLVGLDEGAVGDTLLAVLLQDLVAVAGAQWKQKGRAGGSVLFGATLRDALITVVRASASQAAASLLNSAKVKQLAARLSALVAGDPGVYGSKEWLWLYGVLIRQVIDTGAVPDLSDQKTINAALAAGAGAST
jgi:hypothetical protein